MNCFLKTFSNICIVNLVFVFSEAMFTKSCLGCTSILLLIRYDNYYLVISFDMRNGCKLLPTNISPLV